LAAIAGILERNGFEVSILDNFLNRDSNDALLERIKEMAPDVVGINCDLISIDNVAKIVKRLRAADIPTIVGGPEVSIHPQDTFEFVSPDICVYGEGELTMLEFCKIMRERGVDRAALGEVEGIVYSSDERIVVNPPRRLMEDLDILPFMPLHLFAMDKYSRKSPDGMDSTDLICTSRGCPFKCAFCSNEYVWGKKVRAMSPSRVVDEIEYLMNKWGTKVVYFREDNFTVQRKRALAICDEILARKLDIKWICESRVDVVDDELLWKMKSAGCYSIWFGVESGSQRVLDMLDKGITVEQTESAFKLCRKYGIKPGASAMFGIPGEKKDEMMQTYRLLRRIKPSYFFIAPFLGIPGSRMYDTIVEKNLVYRRYEGLVLPNTEELTWTEKEDFVNWVKFMLNLRNEIQVVINGRLFLRLDKLLKIPRYLGRILRFGLKAVFG
jgi:radical SAM superfamily enzyme YgiQ (UPF0313 family)